MNKPPALLLTPGIAACKRQGRDLRDQPAPAGETAAIDRENMTACIRREF
jgi:hypothetical protein